MVALGGSITCGAGVRARWQTFPTQIFTWINTTFPHINNTILYSCR
jgi:hypothetical protein